MAKKKVEVVPEYAPVEPQNYDPKAPLPGPTESEAKVITKPAKAKQTSFDVLDTNGYVVRTYSAEQHESAENAEAKAREYAGKINGTVK
jgi:hypothetical protein